MGCLHVMESFLIMNLHVEEKHLLQEKCLRTLVNIFLGLEDCLYVGNLDAKRDWGHAKDFVRMQWLMLQQDQPDDYVISTGKQFSVRELIKTCADVIGIEINFLVPVIKKLQLF